MHNRGQDIGRKSNRSANAHRSRRRRWRFGQTPNWVAQLRQIKTSTLRFDVASPLSLLRTM